MAAAAPPAAPATSPPPARATPTSPSGGAIVKGSMIYSVVAKNGIILAEDSMKTGSYKEVVQHILSHLPPGDTRKSLTHQAFIFHYVVSKGVVFLVLADAEYGYRLPFLFLEDIQNQFFGTYNTQINEATLVPRQFEGFIRVLHDKMDFFTNRAHEADKLTAARTEVENVKQIVTKNIDKVLERQEKIETLVEVTEKLNTNAHTYHGKSTALKRKMCRRNAKWTLISVGCSLLIVLILILVLLWFLGIIP
ncbi:vesicle-associated membrane protein [Pelomyxa schiedti]|nr:vesicle-associated membrane protein [Pelomyxa schiedti]